MRNRCGGTAAHMCADLICTAFMTLAGLLSILCNQFKCLLVMLVCIGCFRAPGVEFE